jgi:hypothetical protein
MGKTDLWIAVTARETDRTVLTTDRDFDHLIGTQPTRAWSVDREWVDPASTVP